MCDHEIVSAVRQDRTSGIAGISRRSSWCRDNDAVSHDVLGATLPFRQFRLQVVLADPERVFWFQVDITESEMVCGFLITHHRCE